MVHFLFKDFEKEGEEFLSRLVQRKQELDALRRRSMIDSPLNIGNRASQQHSRRNRNNTDPNEQKNDERNVVNNPLHH